MTSAYTEDDLVLLYNKNFLRIYSTREEVRQTCWEVYKTATCACVNPNRKSDDSRFCGEIEEKAKQLLLEIKLPLAIDERRARYNARKVSHRSTQDSTHLKSSDET